MKRLDPADLEMSIYVQLRVLRGATRTHLQRLGTDMACKTVARLIIERCLSGCAIFKPSSYYKWQPAGMGRGDGHVEHAGRFGDTEPWPHPPVAPASPDRCRLCTANDIDGLGEDLAKAMWLALEPGIPFEDAGDYRTNFLLMAHRAVNWLGRAHGTSDVEAI